MKRDQPWPRPRYFFSTNGNQLLHDGVAVGPEVGGVHGVRVVVVGIGVLNFNHDRAWEIRPGPVLVELIGVLLLHPVVALHIEASREVGRQVRIGRRLAPARDGGGEVPVVDEERVLRVRMRVEALGQQHVHAEMHRPAPELREQRALDALVLHVLRVGGCGNRRDDLVERDRHGAARHRIDGDLARRRVEVARGQIPLLAFAAVHRQLHRVAVAAREGLVAVEERLHGVGAGGNVGESLHGEADGAAGHARRRAAGPAFEIETEDRLPFRPRRHVEARLAVSCAWRASAAGGRRAVPRCATRDR